MRRCAAYVVPGYHRLMYWKQTMTSTSVYLWTTTVLTLLLFFIALVTFVTIGNFSFGISTDVNSGDVDDTFAIIYAVTKGFFVNGWFSRIRAFLRWFIPFVPPCTIRIALESKADMQLFLGQLNTQMYGPVTRVRDGFLTANYELIEIYQAGYKVSFRQSDYGLIPIPGSLHVHLLEVAGPTSCLFNTTYQLIYVGRLSVKGHQVVKISGANAMELSKECIENALQNGSRVNAMPLEFSRNILCSLGSQSPLLSVAAQLQLNPWAFSFLQHSKVAPQFAESNQEIGALLFEKMGLTYNAVWEKLDCTVRMQVTDFTKKFSDWNCPNNIIRNRILWAVFNFGGKFPWHSESCTSVDPPFNDLCSILNTDKQEMNALEIFDFRVQNVSSFTGLMKGFVAEVLSHAVLYDLYAMVLLKYNLSAESVARDPRVLAWFNNHVQQFVDSLNLRTK